MTDHGSADHDARVSRPTILHRADWATDAALWKGKVEGKDFGTGVSVLFYSTRGVGEGPCWHVHSYDEIFIVRKGRALFTIGDAKVEAKAGDILLGPSNIPHKYHSLGPEMLETIDIHLSEQWIQMDLDDPELPSKEDC